MAYATRIDVVLETEKGKSKGKRFRVMVNCIKRQDYSNVLQANKEALALQAKEMPHAQINLCPHVYA